MSRLLLTVLHFLLVPVLARAALDPEADKPYPLHVILAFKEHRTLTPLFQEQVQRELRTSLQGAFGNAAHVTVTRASEERALDRMKELRPAEGWRLVGDAKTHFVGVEFVNGRYEVAARQHDGSTGLSTPEGRRAHTSDRLLVARTAALLIEQDFGVTGVCAPVPGSPPQGAKVTLTLKGSKLGAPLDRWVRPGEVFVLAQISAGAGGPRAAAVPGAFLQVAETPRDGVCACRLYYRYVDPLPGGPGVLGYRGLKLGTLEAPLRLRFVGNDRAAAPLVGLTVSVATDGFDGPNPEQHATNASGFVETKRAYRHMAFVRVIRDAVIVAQFAVPIVDDRAVVCPVGVSREAEERGPLELRKRRLLRQLYESLQVHANLVEDLNKTAEKSREGALKKAKAGLELLKDELLQLADALTKLRADAGKLAAAMQRDFAEAEQRLQELRGRREALERYLTGLTAAIAEENDPKVQAWKGKIQTARLLEEEEAEFDKAIALYEQVLAEAKNEPQLREHLDKLKRAWQPRSEEHAKVRMFIYETWPKQKEAAQIKEHLPEARKALQLCRGVKDKLAPRKLFLAGRTHAGNLQKELDALRPSASDDDRKAFEIIEETAADLKKLLEEVRDYLK